MGLKVTVLVDNATLIDRYYRAEPALSMLVETGGKKILLDCGYSGLFLENARSMGISLDDVDAVVFSHSHLDHTWGVETLVPGLRSSRWKESRAPAPRSWPIPRPSPRSHAGIVPR